MVWFDIMKKIQDETQNLAKSMHFHISPNLIGKKKWNIRVIINKIYKKFQNISFENSSWGKHVFGKKKKKKRPQNGQ